MTGNAQARTRHGDAWTDDRVVTTDGRVVPVRATARRPVWAELPNGVRQAIERAAGDRVVEAASVGTGFTPGFASRLRLANGSDLFVKAASSADDALHGWGLTGAYREEGRKLALLDTRFHAPALQWSLDEEVDGVRWIVLGLEYVDGRPPRRPWLAEELTMVTDAVLDIAAPMAAPPPGLGLATIDDDLVGGYSERLDRVLALQGPSPWLDLVRSLCADADDALAGNSLVHLDLRDDNVLIGDNGQVWFVDWNFPALGAPWIDLVCILLSAHGDGHDTDRLLAMHPVSADADPHAIDVLLAVMWSHWGIAMTEPVPPHSPHLRDHQRWYGDVTRGWLVSRRAARGAGV